MGNIAEKNISQDSIFNKAADLLIDKIGTEAMEILTKERIASRPEFTIYKISNDEMEGALQAIAMPEVKIGDRSSINIVMKVDEVTEEEVKKEVEQLDTLLTKEVEQNDGNPIVDGDLTNIDFLGKIDGTPFDGGKAEGFDLKIGSKSFIDNFEEQLIGMKKGDSKTITVKFPEQYPSEDLKGKEAQFDVTINSIKQVVKLENEELKAKLKEFGFDSKEALIKKIKEVTKDKKVSEAEDKYFREYFDAIIGLKDTKITIPESILKQEIQQEWTRMEAQVAKSGMEMKSYLEMLKLTKEEFEEQNLKESSEKRIKDSLIYAQLIEDLGLKATIEEVEAEYKKLAELNKTDIEKVKSEITQASIEGNIIYVKLIAALSK